MHESSMYLGVMPRMWLDVADVSWMAWVWLVGCTVVQVVSKLDFQPEG